MKSGADYGWVVFIGIAVLIAFLWKPLSGVFGNVSNKLTNKEGYERGKAVFYDATRWEAGKYRSCAMCHASDFKFETGKTTDMQDYKEGMTPVVLKNMKAKYYTSIGSDDEMLAAINKCMSMPSRIGTGTFSLQAPWMQDLLEYVKGQ
jgi:hypothetical protein